MQYQTNRKTKEYIHTNKIKTVQRKQSTGELFNANEISATWKLRNARMNKEYQKIINTWVNIIATYTQNLQETFTQQ